MSNEFLRRQFDHNKEQFERSKAKERVPKQRWGYVFRAATASLAFLLGAGLEAGTKLFKDSLPPRLKEGLCYMSDVLRSSEYPHRFTIVILPFKNDTDDFFRKEVRESILIHTRSLSRARMVMRPRSGSLIRSNR